MNWRWRIILVTGMTVFSAATWAARPYWDSVMRSETSVRGRLARERRATDTASDAIGRAALGGGVGLVGGLLSFTVRDYRKERGRRLHWTGLEIRRK